MVAAIDRSGALDAVLPILMDPCQLLIAYLRAKGTSAISSALAREVAVMGS